MPDDPAAIARLEQAVRQVKRVFRNAPGSPHWGDGLPHHPHLRRGMTAAQIEFIESRPARLRPDELDWEEVGYFFSHSGYGNDPAQDLPPSIRYFLPRLAEATLHRPTGNIKLDLQVWRIFEVIEWHFPKVPWHSWPAAEATAIRDWLNAWTNIAIRYRPDEWFPGWTLPHVACYMHEPRQTLRVALAAGLPPAELLHLTVGLDQEQTVHLAALVVIGCDHLCTAAHAVLDEWVSAESTSNVLMDAALSQRPWSNVADQILSFDVATYLESNRHQ